MSALQEIILRIWKPVRHLIDRYRVTAAERGFLRSTDRANTRLVEGSPVVLVEAVEDHYYLALFAHLVAGLGTEREIDAQQFVPRSLRPGATRSLLHAVKAIFYYNALTDLKWFRLYGAYCSRLAYKSVSPLFSRAAIADLMEARRIWRNLESKDSLTELRLSGIKMGDLIYDSYLRYKPAATVDLKSRYLWLVIWQTLRDVRASRAYMFDVKPRLFLTSYSTYIQHGVAVRVALAAGVKVFSFGNFQEFYKQLHVTDWVHTRNTDRYRSEFARLDNAVSKIAEAERALAARLSGTIDAATAFMRRSAYGSTAELPDGISGSLVVFLHDFFDSPHCYQWILFPDFWEWATFTLNLARRAGIRAFVKPHPNQIFSSTVVVRRLMDEYPEVTWLSTRTSNVQLAEAGAACAVTVHGTVAHEMAYLGIPTIAAGHNPHISFAICHTARSRDEYRRLILNYRNLHFSPEKLRRESLEFYWMHNLALAADDARLQNIVVRFRALVNSKGGWLYDGDDFVSFAKELNAEPAFRKSCKQLATHLDDDCREGTLHNSAAAICERAAAR